MSWLRIQIRTDSRLLSEGGPFTMPVESSTGYSFSSSSTQWTVFTGDQLGVLFANRVLEAHKDSEKPLARLGMVASTVSSRMVKKIAQVEGFRFVDCLTGQFPK